MGDMIAGDKAANPGDDEKVFADILKSVGDCLQIHSQAGSSAPVSLDSVLSYLSSEWGPAVLNDRWINWHFHDKDGAEKRLRLEVTENDEGIAGRELHYYAVDREGLPVPVELENFQTHNPSDDSINSILKESDVFYKEKAGSGVFTNGAHMDYMEKNGALAEFEIDTTERIFRCSSLKAPKESCRCVH